MILLSLSIDDCIDFTYRLSVCLSTHPIFPFKTIKEKATLFFVIIAVQQ